MSISLHIDLFINLFVCHNKQQKFVTNCNYSEFISNLLRLTSSQFFWKKAVHWNSKSSHERILVLIRKAVNFAILLQTTISLHGCAKRVTFLQHKRFLNKSFFPQNPFQTLTKRFKIFSFSTSSGLWTTKIIIIYKQNIKIIIWYT